MLLKVWAFGLNGSELHFRQGVAYSGSFPRIPGIEAAGVVEDAPGGEFAPGTRVFTMMGGMRREFDGGYAEYVVAPAATRPGDSILIRGGTSSVGLAVAVLAKLRGMTVYATTRREAGRAQLEEAGVDHVLIDDGNVAEQIRRIAPAGVDGAVELVGVDVIKDTLRAVRTGGTVCFTGMLSDHWTIPDFYPMEWLPNGVRLTAYAGEASDLSARTLQDFLDAVRDGRARIPLGRVYRLDEIVQAHRDMEAGRAGGKGVVLP